MKIICLKNTGSYPSLVFPINKNMPESFDNSVISSEWYTIDSDVSGYPLTVGKEYIIYGILNYHDNKRYLILDDYGVPYYMPSELFQESNADETDWDWITQCFDVCGSECYVRCSEDLIGSYEDIISLIRLDERMLRRILAYKKFVEEYFL